MNDVKRMIMKCEVKHIINADNVKTPYQYYMWRHDSLETIAISRYLDGDMDLAAFYKNAAEGFKRKAVACGN
ncbi:MAG: hypothetical protein MJ176_03475 [Treponema sp.]|nr:hypothetical protein [Treponema sp.]